MGEHMVRKQIYLPRRQNLLLKRLAKQRGVSEAEVIRQALQREVEVVPSAVRSGAVAWDEVVRFVEARKASLAGEGEPIHWNRQELYEERENRWLKPKTE